MRRGGAYQRDGIAGHQNIGIRRLAAAVNHPVINAVIEDQQRAFCRKHGDAQIGVFRDALAPDPGGVDDDLRVNATRFTALMIVDLYAVHTIAPAQQTGDLAAGKDLRAVFAGVEHIGGRQAERIDGAVRYPVRRQAA